MKESHWRSITDVAQDQKGLITSAQLRMTGTSPTAIDRLVHEGRLHPVRNRVYVLAGVPDDPARRIRAVALVTPKAVVSHRSAAWLYGLLARQPRHVDVLVEPRTRLTMHGVIRLEGRFEDDDVTTRDGIRTTTVVRTLIDLHAVLPPRWVERLVHESVLRRLCEYDDLRSAAESWRSEGAAAMLDLLDGVFGTTPLEAQWDAVLRDASLPPPVRQHQVVVGRRVFVLDYAWPAERVALEVDGFAAHRTRAAFDRDHDKRTALQAAGWSVVSATARSRKGPVLAALRRLLAFSPAPGAGENARVRVSG